VLLFDIGVYVLVVGATVLMLIALAHQSLRSPRRIAVPAADGEGELPPERAAG
jgi:multicomponent K+:H+ antiporter subunit A